MNGKINGLVKAAASLSLAGGILAAAAGPAAAATPNEAYGVGTTGLIAVSPLGLATFPGTSPVTVAHANIGGLVTTGIVTDTADATSASSTVANPAVTLSGIATLRAAVITSSCSFNANTGLVTRTSGITRGQVVLIGGVPITLNAAAAPNTTVSVPGIATITLNRHFTIAGTPAVDAVYVQLLGSTQTVTIAQSVCNAANLAPVPVLPGASLPIGLGLIALLGLGGVGFQVSRRRRQAAAA